MSLLSWLKMNLILDIVCGCFIIGLIWKNRKIKQEIAEVQSDLGKMKQEIAEVQSDLEVTMKNPQAAKRLLKERKK